MNRPFVARVALIALIGVLQIGGCHREEESSNGPGGDTSGRPGIIAPASLPDGSVGAPYAVAFSATGASPIHWSVTAGTAPPGLTLSPDGSYGGIPAVAASYTLTVTATNAAGSDSRQYGHTIGTSGSYVPAFGPGGAIQLPRQLDAIAVDATAVYIAATDFTSPSNARWRIEKRDKMTGALVGGFGTGGIITIDPTPSHDATSAIAVSATHLYVAGYAGGGDASWRIEKRSLGTGELDGGFGSGGVVSSNPSSGHDVPAALVIDGTSLYIVGGTAPAIDIWGVDTGWRVERRSLADGSLVGGFGIGGVVQSSPTPLSDEAVAAALDASGLYVFGNASNPLIGAPYPIAPVTWWIEKRDPATGAPVAAFGGGGAVAISPSSYSNGAAFVTVDGGAVFLGGTAWLSPPLNAVWHVQKRSATDGSLVGAFGFGGILTIDPSPQWDFAQVGAAEGAALWVGGAGPDAWRVEKRSAVDGSVVGSFGTGGAVTSVAGSIVSLALDAGTLYLGGHGGGPSESRVEKRYK